MTRLLLIGASGLAQEAITIAREMRPHVEVRILDDDQGRWGSNVGGVPVVGGLEALAEHPDHHLAVCVGRGPLRRTIVERLYRLGVVPQQFATLVHPAIRVPAGCVVGVGSIVIEGSVLTAGVTVGEHVVVMPNVTLTHGNTVHDHATLCAGVALGGDVRILPGAYIGMNASVRERVQVGRDAVLGMGSVLLADLPDGERWAGIPARPLNQRMEVAR